MDLAKTFTTSTPTTQCMIKKLKTKLLNMPINKPPLCSVNPTPSLLVIVKGFQISSWRVLPKKGHQSYNTLLKTKIPLINNQRLTQAAFQTSQAKSHLHYINVSLAVKIYSRTLTSCAMKEKYQTEKIPTMEMTALSFQTLELY